MVGVPAVVELGDGGRVCAIEVIGHRADLLAGIAGADATASPTTGLPWASLTVAVAVAVAAPSATTLVGETCR